MQKVITLPVSTNLLEALFSKGVTITTPDGQALCTDGLPEGATLRDVDYSPMRADGVVTLYFNAPDDTKAVTPRYERIEASHDNPA